MTSAGIEPATFRFVETRSVRLRKDRNTLPWAQTEPVLKPTRCFCYYYFRKLYDHVVELSRYSDSIGVERSADRIPVGARFSVPLQTDLGAHPTSYRMGTGSFPGVQRPGSDDSQPTSSTEVKGRVELYLYSPYGP